MEAKANNRQLAEIEAEVYLTSNRVKIAAFLDSFQDFIPKTKMKSVIHYLENGGINDITISPYLDEGSICRWEKKRADNTGKEDHDIILLYHFWYNGDNEIILKAFRDFNDENELEIL